jgi:homoserine O-acetyltransferase
MSTPLIHRCAEPFETESGFVFERPVIAYRTWGALSEARDNVVVVCHALTGDTDAADWWAPLFGAGRVCDPERHFVLCANVLGSCYGTTGPRSIDPATGQPYGGRFPRVTVRDTVRLHRHLLDVLGVRGVEVAIGGSMGGMQALEWGLLDERVRRLALIAIGPQHTPWQIGISEAQRQAIYADARWHGGDYPPDDPPVDGLAAARMMAMMSYRSPALFDERFGRGVCDADVFEIESYLRYQGAKLADRFDAASYVRLTQLMDSFDPAAARGPLADVLGAVAQSALVVGIRSDVLYPPADARRLAALLPHATYAELDSDFGHDAFLADAERLHDLMAPFLRAHDLLAPSIPTATFS